jgi:hypothetical protein
MIISTLCHTRTPKNCRNDFDSPLFLIFQKPPVPMAWRAPGLSYQKCLFGTLESKPGLLGIYMTGDPLFLPADFKALETGSISITREDAKCPVAKIYLTRSLVKSLIKNNVALARSASFSAEYQTSPSFMFWVVNTRITMPEAEPFISVSDALGRLRRHAIKLNLDPPPGVTPCQDTKSESPAPTSKSKSQSRSGSATPS